MERCIIAAVADNGAIGKDNDLLWHIAEDMRYFRRTTVGNPVVMGYRTFISIGGKPLPKRDNIVISTRSWDDVPSGVCVAGGLEEAYSLAERAVAASRAENGTGCVPCGSGTAAGPTGSRASATASDEPRIFIIGGGETYRRALPTADKLYITHVHTEIKDADTFFPEIDPAIWEVISSEPAAIDPGTGLSYEFTVYGRRFRCCRGGQSHFGSDGGRSL